MRDHDSHAARGPQCRGQRCKPFGDLIETFAARRSKARGRRLTLRPAGRLARPEVGAGAALPAPEINFAQGRLEARDRLREQQRRGLSRAHEGAAPQPVRPQRERNGASAHLSLALGTERHIGSRKEAALGVPTRSSVAHQHDRVAQRCRSSRFIVTVYRRPSCGFPARRPDFPAAPNLTGPMTLYDRHFGLEL